MLIDTLLLKPPSFNAPIHQNGTRYKGIAKFLNYMPSRKSHAMACLGPHDEGEKYLEKKSWLFFASHFYHGMMMAVFYH